MQPIGSGVVAVVGNGVSVGVWVNDAVGMRVVFAGTGDWIGVGISSNVVSWAVPRHPINSITIGNSSLKKLWLGG